MLMLYDNKFYHEVHLPCAIFTYFNFLMSLAGCLVRNLEKHIHIYIEKHTFIDNSIFTGLYPLKFIFYFRITNSHTRIKQDI